MRQDSRATRLSIDAKTTAFNSLTNGPIYKNGTLYSCARKQVNNDFVQVRRKTFIKLIFSFLKKENWRRMRVEAPGRSRLELIRHTHTRWSELIISSFPSRKEKKFFFFSNCWALIQRCRTKVKLLRDRRKNLKIRFKFEFISNVDLVPNKLFFLILFSKWRFIADSKLTIRPIHGIFFKFS